MKVKKKRKFEIMNSEQGILKEEVNGWDISEEASSSFGVVF